MPRIERRIKQKVVVREPQIQQSGGEITLNINLDIKIDEQEISRYIESPREEKPIETSSKPAEIVPSELFADSEELLEGFGS